jgi:hypothetical protein
MLKRNGPQRGVTGHEVGGSVLGLVERPSGGCRIKKSFRISTKAGSTIIRLNEKPGTDWEIPGKEAGVLAP